MKQRQSTIANTAESEDLTKKGGKGKGKRGRGRGRGKGMDFAGHVSFWFPLSPNGFKVPS